MPEISSLGENIVATIDQSWKHNWLYSVLPLGDEMYLSGYCRACDQAFSKTIWRTRVGEKVFLGQMGIPKWGCVDPSQI